ncbi:hypothetical protein OG588_36070 [Streptomyces prunicolor]|uniref:hypothetical protein n=1 Tax=Streptomyces prunicolor TaxID=67348 RepID=UPI0038662F5D|nr:hypothetical protein OG588_36070 [Streptomyces prunicolor]
MGGGVAFAVEPFGNSACLWTETDAVAATDSSGVTNAWGSKIARFKFANGTVLNLGSSQVTKFSRSPEPTGSAYSDFQGFTALGQYLYMIDGNAYTYADSTTTTPTDPDGNTYVTRIDWNTGSVSDRQLTKAAQSLYFREPEGLAIQIPDTSDTAACRPARGFASEHSATDTDKMAGFPYKKSLI